MRPRNNRVIVYRRAWIWYAECPDCPGEEKRMRAPWLPYAHGMAMRHVRLHKAGVVDE
jgi:hypothetical protein